MAGATSPTPELVFSEVTACKSHTCCCWDCGGRIKVDVTMCSFPPAKYGRFGAAGRYFLHMYQAHIAAYEAIKASDGA